MKKIILSLLIALVLSWSCEMVFAKEKGGGKSGGGQKADADKPADKSEQVRKQKREKDRERKQEQWNEQKKERVREMKRKGKEKSRAGKDVGELADRTKKGKARVKSVEKDAGKGVGVEKGAGKGKRHQQQMTAIGKQMLREDAKHRKRLVRLRRIRVLAVKEGATKVVERVDKLLGKERQRYERKLQRMVGRKEKSLQLGEKSLGREAQKAVKQAGDKGKGKAEAKERKEIKGKEKDTEKKTEE